MDPSNLAQSAMPIIAENQWLTQNAYQNVDPTTVDWAAIAQQWIHMRESYGPSDIPNAPPPPRISSQNSRVDFEEKGEAPMEVEHEEEQPTQSIPLSAPPPPPANAFPSSNWPQNNETNRPKQWNSKRGNRWGSKVQRNDNFASGQVFNSKHANNSWPAESVQSSGQTNNALDANDKSGIQLEQVGLNSTPSLDAAQRKTLPAWIR